MKLLTGRGGELIVDRQAECPADRGVQIGDAGLAVDDAGAFCVGRSISLATLDSTARDDAGKGGGDNVSPALQLTGVPAEAKQLVLIMDDLDVPMPKPPMHTIAGSIRISADSRKVNSSPAPPVCG